MWVYPAVHAQTWKTTTVCTKTGPWREFILSLVFFTVYVLSRVSFQAGNPVNKQTNFPVKSNRCFLSGSQLYMQASFYIVVRNGFSMNFSICGSSAWWSRTCMVRVTALDIQVNLRNPTPCWRTTWHQRKAIYMIGCLYAYDSNGDLIWCPEYECMFGIVDISCRMHFFFMCTKRGSYLIIFVLCKLILNNFYHIAEQHTFPITRYYSKMLLPQIYSHKTNVCNFKFVPLTAFMHENEN